MANIIEKTYIPNAIPKIAGALVAVEALSLLAKPFECNMIELLYSNIIPTTGSRLLDAKMRSPVIFL